MKLKILKKGDGNLEMAVGGEGHSLLNLLQNSLLENKDVEMAGYSKPHPLMDRSILYVKMKGEKPPEKALLDAAENAKKKVNEFLSEFEGEISKLKERE
jgi:DNA-directed RNA polymerase subunit L